MNAFERVGKATESIIDKGILTKCLRKRRRRLENRRSVLLLIPISLLVRTKMVRRHS